MIQLSQASLLLSFSGLGIFVVFVKGKTGYSPKQLNDQFPKQLNDPFPKQLQVEHMRNLNNELIPIPLWSMGY